MTVPAPPSGFGGIAVEPGTILLRIASGRWLRGLLRGGDNGLVLVGVFSFEGVGVGYNFPPIFR